MITPNKSSQRAASVEDYENTCADFIAEISKDYKDWVDRYQLTE